MSRIKVTNTAIIIEDYELGSNDRLERPYKVFDPIYHRFNYFGLYYDKEAKKLYLHGGNNLWNIKRALGEQYYDRITHHPYKTIDKDVKLKFPPRDEEQLEALKFMCDIDEYKDNENFPIRLLSLSTGKGKTFCSIATIAFFKIKSIIITSSNTLLHQWESEILKYTNLTKQDISYISGSDECNMIIKGSSKKRDSSIFLCTQGTLRSFGENYGWDQVYNLFETIGIGIKIYDEAHSNFDAMMMIDFFTNVYRTYMVTATPARSNYYENKIYQISLSQVPMIDLFDETSDPHTHYVAIKWNSKPTADVISKCRNKYGLDRMKYIDYLTQKPEFYDMLRVIMKLVLDVIFNKDLEKRGVVLMYIGTNNGILRVYHWIATNYPELIGDIGIFSSLVPKEDKLKEKKKKLLLSTTSSAGKGEHIDRLKLTIVLAEPFKSQVTARQTLGRTRDRDTVYIEMVDMGFKYTRKFYYDKLKTFNKYALDVSDDTIDPYEMSKRAENIEKERFEWRPCPIAFKDDRFDFESALPKKRKKEENGIRKAVRFFNKDGFIDD